jgi:hypothetical protein
MDQPAKRATDAILPRLMSAALFEGLVPSLSQPRVPLCSTRGYLPSPAASQANPGRISATQGPNTTQLSVRTDLGFVSLGTSSVGIKRRGSPG